MRMLWILRGLCVAGLGISVYLAWTALSMTPVYGCGGGDVIDCGHVLKSKWSKVFGIPVSVPAGGLYASMLVLLGFAGLNAPRAMKQMVWNALTAGSCMAGLAALWFISLQIFALSKICPYCVAVHTCGLVMAALMLRNRFSEPHHKRMAASFSAAAVAGLSDGHLSQPRVQYRHRRTRRTGSRPSAHARCTVIIALAPLLPY